jgi:hypothetical protein
MTNLTGANLAGTSGTRDRVNNDFYATPDDATIALLKVENFEGSILEPACGNGAISGILLRLTPNVTSYDLVDRGYGQQRDFFSTKNKFWEDGGYDAGEKFDNIITNPPFSLFLEFAERSLTMVNKKIALFGKLQALEGQKRATFLENSPLKTVYVFKKRVNPLRNGSPVDENGKPWASTMAFAWYVWEIGYRGKPQIEWI